MNWEDVEKIGNLVEREKAEIKYYLEEVKIEDWLLETEPQTIRFLDRWEYKINGLLHRMDGPAIEGIEDNPTGNIPLSQYYIKGEKYESREDYESSPEYIRHYRKGKLDRVKSKK